jgi:hypothetical protein
MQRRAGMARLLQRQVICAALALTAGVLADIFRPQLPTDRKA